VFRKEFRNVVEKYVEIYKTKKTVFMPQKYRQQAFWIIIKRREFLGLKIKEKLEIEATG
jgi:hypothetical protein